MSIQWLLVHEFNNLWFDDVGVGSIDYRRRGCRQKIQRQVWFVEVAIRYPHGSVILVVVWIQAIFMMDGLFLFVIGSGQAIIR